MYSQIQVYDELPATICANCADNLVAISQFREIFLESDCKLRQRLTEYDVEFLTKEEDDSDDIGQTDEQNNDSAPHGETVNAVKNETIHIFEEETFAEIEILADSDDVANVDEDDEQIKYINRDEEDDGNTLYKCDHCEKSFSSMASLRTHNYIHNQGHFKCHLCPNKVLTNAGFLRVHLEKAHNIFTPKEKLRKEISPTQPLKNERKCLCEICNRYFTKIGIMAHMRAHQSNEVKLTNDGKKVIKCPMCLLTFSCRRNVQRHIKNVHSEGKQNRPAIYSCHMCSDSFQIVVQLYEHYKTHDENCRETVEGYNLDCDDCDKCFTTYESYAKHVVDVHHHEKVRPYKCRLCEMRRGTRVALYMHINCHYEVTPSTQKRIMVKVPRKRTVQQRYLCPTCGNDFCTKQILKHHQLIHTGQKPYQCTHCQKTFRGKSALNEHVRMHTGERPYACDKCSKGFRSHSNLRNHKISAHSDVKKHSCHICNRSFKFAANLR